MLKHIFTTKSPFARASICALTVGVANIVALGADLAWLICDLIHNRQPYHAYIGIGLAIGLFITILSFWYLYQAMKLWETRMQVLEEHSVELVDHACSHNEHIYARAERNKRNAMKYKYIETTD